MITKFNEIFNANKYRVDEDEYDYSFIPDFLTLFPHILGNPRIVAFELKDAFLSSDNLTDLKYNLSIIFNKYNFKMIDVNKFNIWNDDDEVNTEDEIMDAIKWYVNDTFKHEITLKDYAHSMAYLFIDYDSILDEDEINELKLKIIRNDVFINEMKIFCEKNNIRFEYEHFLEMLENIDDYLKYIV